MAGYEAHARLQGLFLLDTVKLMLYSIAQHEAVFNSIVSRLEGEGLTDC
jgi:hypothetical protein